MNRFVYATLSSYSCREPRLEGLLFSVDPPTQLGYRLTVQRFTVCGDRFKIITFAGKREVYEIEPDGVETFIGFESELMAEAGMDQGDVPSLGVA